METPPAFNIYPVKNHTIEIMNENLNFKIFQDNQITQAHVSAQYRLKNVSNEEQRITVAFPYVGGYLNTWLGENRNQTVRVSHNGTEVNYQVKNLNNIGFDYRADVIPPYIVRAIIVIFFLVGIIMITYFYKAR